MEITTHTRAVFPQGLDYMAFSLAVRLPSQAEQLPPLMTFNTKLKRNAGCHRDMGASEHL